MGVHVSEGWTLQDKKTKGGYRLKEFRMSATSIEYPETEFEPTPGAGNEVHPENNGPSFGRFCT